MNSRRKQIIGCFLIALAGIGLIVWEWNTIMPGNTYLLLPIFGAPMFVVVGLGGMFFTPPVLTEEQKQLSPFKKFMTFPNVWKGISVVAFLAGIANLYLLGFIHF